MGRAAILGETEVMPWLMAFAARIRNLTVVLTLAVPFACTGGGHGDDVIRPDAALSQDVSGLPPCSIGLAMADIEAKLFRGPKCMACHGRPGLFPTTLNLSADGLAARVIDKGGETDPNKGKCAGRIMVPRADPLGGIFIEKVQTAKPSCGDVMPQSMPMLTLDEISCVKRWVLLAVDATPAP